MFNASQSIQSFMNRTMPFLGALLTAFVVMSCEPNNVTEKPGAPEARYAEMKVIMHDTAGPYSQVNVHIVGAEIHVTDSNDTAWVPLNVNQGIYDLLVLQNGIDTILANQTIIPVGYLGQLRLLLGDSNSIVLNDSVTTYPLKTPSGQQSGLKININDSIQAYSQIVLILDFDADRSVVHAGNDKYILKPVIKVDSIYTN